MSAIYTPNVEYEYTLDSGPWPKGFRTMMDEHYPIPPGFVRVSHANLIPTPVAMPGPTIWGSVPDKYGPSLDGKRLTKEGELMHKEWTHLYKAEGCKCHDSVVCQHCSHPGHPYALEHNTRMWEDVPPQTRADKIMEAIREQAGRGNT